MSERGKVSWRPTRQRRRTNSADRQTPGRRYLGISQSTKNLRRESRVVMEVDSCLLSEEEER